MYMYVVCIVPLIGNVVIPKSHRISRALMRFISDKSSVGRGDTLISDTHNLDKKEELNENN